MCDVLTYYEDLLIFFAALFYIALGVSLFSMRRFALGRVPWRLLGLCCCAYGGTVWLTLASVQAHLPCNMARCSFWMRAVIVTLAAYGGFLSVSTAFQKKRTALFFFPFATLLFLSADRAGYGPKVLIAFTVLAMLLVSWGFLRTGSRHHLYHKLFVVLAITMCLSGLMLAVLQFLRVGQPAELPTPLHFTRLSVPVFLALVALIAELITLGLIQKRILTRKYGPGVLRGTMRGWWYLILSAVTMLSGSLLFTATIKQTEETLHQTMLDTADILAQTIDPEDSRALTGDASDLQNPAYRRLKNHLMRQRKFLPHLRFICLMQLRNGQALVLADSEPEESEDYSPPGDVYYEASKELLNGMRSNKHFTEGLCRDRWGTWISAYSPVRDHDTEETIAFLSLDMDATVWSKIVQKSGINPLMITVIILCLLTAIHYQLLELAIERSRAERAHRRQVGLNRRLKKTLARADELAFEAEAATVAKTRFLSNMTHELRTPLNGVLGISELILDGDLTPEQQADFARTIHQSGQQLLRIINDILDYTRIETGMIDWNKKTFNFQETLQPLLSEAASRADQKGLRFSSAIDPQIPALFHDDQKRLLQMLMHLLDNAIKFTHSGCITFRAELLRSEKKTAYILFTITDTGIGIPPERVQKMFAPFIQLDASDTRKYGGIGIGLAICRKLCDFIGGAIKLESAPDKGTTAWLTIPLSLPPKETAQ